VRRLTYLGLPRGSAREEPCFGIEHPFEITADIASGYNLSPSNIHSSRSRPFGNRGIAMRDASL